MCPLWCMCVFVVCGVWCVHVKDLYVLKVCTHFTDFCHTRMSIDIFIFEHNIKNISNSNTKHMAITSIFNTYVCIHTVCISVCPLVFLYVLIHPPFFFSPISFDTIGTHTQWDILLLPPDLHWLLPRLISLPLVNASLPLNIAALMPMLDGALWPTWWLLCWMCTDTVKAAVECTLDVWHDNNTPTCMHEHTRTPKCSHSRTTLIPSHAQLHTAST